MWVHLPEQIWQFTTVREVEKAAAAETCCLSSSFSATSTSLLLDGSRRPYAHYAQRKRRSLKTLGRSTNSMIPLIPALVLAFLSFLCSAFVILRIIIPILPPHPLSRRVRPVCSLALRRLESLTDNGT